MVQRSVESVARQKPDTQVVGIPFTGTSKGEQASIWLEELTADGGGGEAAHVSAPEVAPLLGGRWQVLVVEELFL